MSLRLKLEKQSDEEQKYLESEILKISEKGKKIALNGLYIAGGLALTYLLFKYFIEDEKPEKTTKPVKIDETSEEVKESFLGGITKTFAKEAALIILTMAKDKLVEYLNKDSESNEEHPSRASK